MNLKSFSKIIFYNAGLFCVLLLLTSVLFEIFARSHNPFSVFPKNLTAKKSFEFNNKNFFIADAKPSLSVNEPKTNTLYTHNSYGFRARLMDDEFSLRSQSQSTPIVLSIGDSTNYGLNLDITDTFSYLFSQGLGKNLINTSYPGINLNGIYYKLECARALRENDSLRIDNLLISLYYNDLETLEPLPLNSSNCEHVRDLNIVNASLNSRHISEQSTSSKSFIDKLVSFSSYPSYMNKLICGTIFPMTCKYVKFSLSNISPNVRNLVFGTTRQELSGTSKLMTSDNIKDWLNKYRLSLSHLAKDTSIAILYIPRNELDLGFFDSKRESMYSFYNELCQSVPNLTCIDGAEIILSSLSSSQRSSLLNSRRLPDNYYSYLPMYDMGHPSKYVSYLYSQSLLDLQ